MLPFIYIICRESITCSSHIPDCTCACVECTPLVHVPEASLPAGSRSVPLQDPAFQPSCRQPVSPSAGPCFSNFLQAAGQSLCRILHFKLILGQAPPASHLTSYLTHLKGYYHMLTFLYSESVKCTGLTSSKNF